MVPAEAVTRLQALGKIPPAQLTLVSQDGPKITAATAQLTALGKIPPADTKLLTQVQKAAKDSPKQWRNYYWIAVGGEIVFIPLIFLLTGFWSPKRARQEERDHEVWVEGELARLSGQSA